MEKDISLEDMAQQRKGFNNAIFCAPEHLMLPGPDRREEYLASIDGVQEKPRPKRRGGYRGNYKKKERKET
jgi:hypothetical protein